MRYCYFILICLVFTACNTHQNNTEIKDTNPDTVFDTLIPLDCIPKSFKTPLGTNIKYVKVGNEVQLSWGDSIYSRSHNELFSCYDDISGRWDAIPKYDFETENYLVFTGVLSTSGGANPAPIDSYALIMPKKVSDSVYEKNLYLGYKRDYIIYLPQESASTVAVLNVETKKEQLFDLDPPPNIVAKSPVFIIQDIKIVKRQLKVEYEGLTPEDSVVIYKNNFKLDI